ncbi:MAG: hypothetical protein ACOCP8_07395 [archaeon]
MNKYKINCILKEKLDNLIYIKLRQLEEDDKRKNKEMNNYV